MILSPRLNEIYHQIRESAEDSGSDEVQELIAEFEAIGSLLSELNKTDLGGLPLVPFHIGPSPTHCKACGQKIPTGSAGGIVR